VGLEPDTPVAHLDPYDIVGDRHFVAEPKRRTPRRELEALSDDLMRASGTCRTSDDQLVTNSWSTRTAAQGAVRPDVKVTDDVIRVEVRDRGVGFEPHPRGDDDPLSGHWGLQLVDTLADRWHVRGANTVAFEVDRSRAA